MPRTPRCGVPGQTTRAQLIKLPAGNPVLMERPIVVAGTRTALGRPPENVLRII